MLRSGLIAVLGTSLEIERNLGDILGLHLNAGGNSGHRERVLHRHADPSRGRKPPLDALEPVIDIPVLG